MPSRLFSVNIGSGSGGGSGNLVQRSGEQAITNGSNTVTIVYSSSMGGTSYAIEYSILNVTDTDPIMLQGIVTQKTALGFVITLNAAADSANYSINYGVQGYV